MTQYNLYYILDQEKRIRAVECAYTSQAVPKVVEVYGGTEEDYKIVAVCNPIAPLINVEDVEVLQA